MARMYQMLSLDGKYVEAILRGAIWRGDIRYNGKKLNIPFIMGHANLVGPNHLNCPPAVLD